MKTGSRSGLPARLHLFLSRGMWQVDLSAAPRWQQPGLRLLRFGWSVYKGFAAHACLLHASALTVAEVARYVWQDGLSPAELGLHHLDPAVVAAEQRMAEEVARALGQPVVGT